MGNGLPPVVYPGPQNPLGPRALYLGDTLYRIHGTNRPGSIGGAVSLGCFRMHNANFIELNDKFRSGPTFTLCPDQSYAQCDARDRTQLRARDRPLHVRPPLPTWLGSSVRNTVQQCRDEDSELRRH